MQRSKVPVPSPSALTSITKTRAGQRAAPSSLHPQLHMERVTHMVYTTFDATLPPGKDTQAMQLMCTSAEAQPGAFFL